MIAAMLFLATAINYSDRLALSVVLHRPAQRVLHDRAGLLAGGHDLPARLRHHVRRLGLRGRPAGDAARFRGLHLRLVVRRPCCTGWRTGKWSLAACRFVLGLGEPGNWPAAAKAVAEWFPARQRALGVGIFNAGSSLGSALAPPVVAFLTMRFGWRFGVRIHGQPRASCGWRPGSCSISRRTESLAASRRIRRLKDQVRPPEEPSRSRRQRVNWRKVIGMRECYTLILARFFTDPVIYFVIFWLPEYLRKERGFDLAMVGQYAWVPFICRRRRLLAGRLAVRPADARRLDAAQGAQVRHAAGRGDDAGGHLAPLRARSVAGHRRPSASSPLGHAFWVSNLQTLPTDLFRGTRWEPPRDFPEWAARSAACWRIGHRLGRAALLVRAGVR